MLFKINSRDIKSVTGNMDARAREKIKIVRKYAGISEQGREKISRHVFLKDAALVVGGATVVGLVALLDACAPKKGTVPQSANEVWIER